jgi:microcystin-dependent protein
MLTDSTVPTTDHLPAPVRRHWLKRFGAVLGSVLLAGPLLARASRRSPTQIQDQDAFLGEIMLAAFAVVPRNFALCNGQLLSINQNAALFSLLGTTYGGDGRTTFALPDLRGRVPRGTGTGYTLGQMGGSELSLSSVANLPAHSHLALASGAAATSSSPIGAVPAVPSGTNLNGEPVAVLAYDPSPNVVATATSSTGGGGNTGAAQSPYLALNYYIALNGVFPSRN